MSYRWFNVKVRTDEDGGATVYFEGRGEFPFGEKDVDWYMKNVTEGETVARLEE
jgi:hypothetical protein